jgi:hypothetical protein
VASQVEICNLALAHLGADTLITSLYPPDGTVESSYCRTFYPHVRRLVLDNASFDFTLRRAVLSQVSVNPSSAWAYAYALPSDCLSPLRVLRSASLLSSGNLVGYNINDQFGYWPSTWDTVFSERGSSEFEVEGNVLLTNEPDAVLKFKADVTDEEGSFPPALVMAMSMTLAGYLAGPIIKGAEGRAAGAAWMRAGQEALDKAAAIDGSNRSERAEFVSAFTRSRS